MATKTEKVTLDLTVPAKVSGPPTGALVRKWLPEDAVLETVVDAQEVKGLVDVLKAEGKARVAWFKPMKDSIAQALDSVREREKAAIAPINDAVVTLQGKLQTWLQAQEVKRKEEERRRREEAEAKAEADRKQQLFALEAAAKATASRIEKQALRSTAQSLATAPVVAAPTAPVAAAPKIAGLYERETWTAEVVDFNMLVVGVAVPLLEQLMSDPRFPLNEVETVGAQKFVAWLRSGFGVAPIDAVAPNQARLNGLATNVRDGLPLPGVRAVKKTTLVSRG